MGFIKVKKMNGKIKELTVDDVVRMLDWFKKIHQFESKFDYRGLIGRGLAIDATDYNI